MGRVLLISLSSKWALFLVLLLVIETVVEPELFSSNNEAEDKNHPGVEEHDEENLKAREEETSESWAEWAKEKISENLHLKTDQSKEVEETKDLASGAAEKAEEMKDRAAENAECTKEKTGECTEAATKTAEEASKKMEEAKEKAEEMRERAAEKAKEADEAPKTKVGETLESAKENIASNYEAVKQKSMKVKDNLAGRYATDSGVDAEL